jgi:hypothetical protein
LTRLRRRLRKKPRKLLKQRGKLAKRELKS